MTNSIYLRPEDYDAQYLDYRVDIPFYLWLAENYAGDSPILEFAPGTLRVTLELAKAGYYLVGVDLSEEMLGFGRIKLAQEGQDVENRVSLHHGNMCDYQVGTKHGLVFVPFTSFLHVLGTENQLLALRNFHSHLLPGGHLVVDIFNPSVDRLARGTDRFQPPTFEKRTVLPDGNILVRYQTTKYNQATQQSQWVFYIEIYDGKTNEMIRKYTEEAVVQLIFPQEWRLLLRTAGFEVIEEFGDFDRNRFGDNSPRMIFLCRKV